MEEYTHKYSEIMKLQKEAFTEERVTNIQGINQTFLEKN